MTTTVLNTRISEVENKMPNTSNLVTPTVLDTKFGKVENKIPHALLLNNLINSQQKVLQQH